MEKIKNWYEQAIYDFETAKFNFEGGKYSTAVFLIQQSVEKFLKAFYIYKKKKETGPTHSLIFLAKELKLTEENLSFLRKLTPEFISTRYPDFLNETPYKLYDENITKEYIDKAERLIKWIKNQMPKL
jgi:HEPN domain-containing protein